MLELKSLELKCDCLELNCSDDLAGSPVMKKKWRTMKTLDTPGKNLRIVGLVFKYIGCDL